jgi:hypothetical protein
MNAMPDLPVIARVCACTKCGRKILVQQILFDGNDIAAVLVDCFDCLDEETRELVWRTIPVEIPVMES